MKTKALNPTTEAGNAHCRSQKDLSTSQDGDARENQREKRSVNIGVIGDG